MAENTFLTRRRLLGSGVLVLAGGALAWRATRPAFAGGALSVAEAHRQATAGTIVLVDIRRPDEWKRTGIGAGAHPIDMRRDDFIAALQRVAGADKDAAIALICARGVRSARLSNRLTEAGFTRIIDVPEGMLGSRAGPGWLKKKLPVEPYEGTS
jgi:rhodanese-related sulfurtransferase